MLSAMKEICIFMIIAQAILFFVPDNAYMKYVRILVGIIMILRISEPVTALFMDQTEQEQIQKQVSSLLENLEKLETRELEGENDMGIYSSIEDELLSKLSECQNENYIVQKVELSYKEQGTTKSNEIEGMTVTVSSAYKKDDSTIKVKLKPVCLTDVPIKNKEENLLKKVYGDFLGMDAERIQVIMLE